MKIRNIDNITLVGDYKNMSTEVLVKCNNCNNIYYTKPQRVLAGHTCKNCAIQMRNKKYNGYNRRKTHEEFVSELNNITNTVTLKEEYKNAKTPILCECLVCGTLWRVRPTNLLTNKTGCPKCARLLSSLKQAYSHDWFLEQINSINPDITIEGEYNNSHKNIKCKCNICKNTWYATPSNLLKGTGCPMHNSSHGEMSIIKWLNKNNISYIHQKKFDGLVGVGGKPLSYDFYIPINNILLEYQGNFHDHTDRIQTDDEFVIRLEHDSRKKKYALDNNYNFFEIWYYDNLEEKLTEIFNIINPVTTTVI